MKNLTHSLGFPRIGERRELKKAVEAYWKGDLAGEALERVGAELRKAHWFAQRDAGIALIPSNDFSFYDQMLDLTCLVGNVPARFSWDGGTVTRDLQFAMARGVAEAASPCECCPPPAAAFACEMTKWFDTNYHYIVPEFHADTVFALRTDKPFAEFREALALGIRTKPVLIGPLTYLRLGKCAAAGVEVLDLLDRLVPVYAEILQQLVAEGAEWIQIDEPILATDLDADWQAAFASVYRTLRAAIPEGKILLASYFGELRGNLSLVTHLPVDALHHDFTRAERELPELLAQLPERMSLSLGVVDGRNIWRNDFERSLEAIRTAQRALGAHRVWLAPSCSLLHVPVSLAQESGLDDELKGWLAFAKEKLGEVTALAQLAEGKGDPVLAYKNRVAVQSRKASERIHKPEVKARCAASGPRDATRSTPFAERRARQQSVLSLALWPTTTIGSFPQTADIRSARAQWKSGKLSAAEYEIFLKQKTEACVRFQEDAGLDVLVHGEFERNDMVEYFGEQLEGFAFTANGWVQSYGSRCVKPPVIFGDVSRPRPMTVAWSAYAQSLTTRPMKGMLTGPITILQWSFVRDDQPRRETAKQIALAIRDEVNDLESAGLRVIQIDEPALREGLPLRRADWNAYLQWATEAFRLSASGVRDETQIHTHMCYCEFNDIMDAIAALDADVISIEASRSQMDLLDAFVAFAYPNGIGPGVWDIHSPRVPSVEEMAELLSKAASVLPVENLWANPDCGLKTRGWPETEAALRNLTRAAAQLREAVHRGIPVNA